MNPNENPKNIYFLNNFIVGFDHMSKVRKLF